MIILSEILFNISRIEVKFNLFSISFISSMKLYKLSLHQLKTDNIK